MDKQNPSSWAEEIDEIISDPLRFKKKLAIGEDAYATLRMKKLVSEYWDCVGVASTTAVVAQSSVVATTFFSSSSLLTAIGIGTAATPVGWVVAASAIAGGGWLGIARFFKQSTNSPVTTIPDFINTPIDILALGLFDLMAPLALKIASIDGDIDISEKEVIISNLTREWGYNSTFVRMGLDFAEKNLSEHSIKDTAKALAEFKKQNKDCNYKEMSQDIIEFLKEIIASDGIIDEREEMAIEKIKEVFSETGKFKFKDMLNGFGR
jgi:tellurite resistance protein